jgi:large subunit ribosomal protein L3
MPLGLLGKKLGHTRVYDANGVLVPVTVVLAGPNRVIQVKTAAGKDGYNAVQLGLEDQKEQRVAKPLLGHFRKFKSAPVKRIKEFRDFPSELPAPPEPAKPADTAKAGDAKAEEAGKAQTDDKKPTTKAVEPGDVLGPGIFSVGDFVDCIGVTKGRGFEGVVGRWAFRGGDSTHGAKGWHRRSGAIGCRLFPGTVNRGMKMPGHMGQARRTAQNLEIIQVRPADNLLLIKGSFPGSEGDYVIIREAKKFNREMVAKRRAAAEARAKAAPAKKGAKAAEPKPAAAPAKK